MIEAGYEIQAIGNISENWFISAGASFAIMRTALKEVAGRTFSIWNLYKYNENLV